MENTNQKMYSKLYQRHKTDHSIQRPNKLQLQYHRSRFNSHNLQKRKKQKFINLNSIKNSTLDQYSFIKSETSDLFNQLSIVKSRHSIIYKKMNSVEPKLTIEPKNKTEPITKQIFIPKGKSNKTLINIKSRKSFKNEKKMSIGKNIQSAKRRKSDNITRKKTNKQFWFLEDPEYFEGSSTSSSKNETNNPKRKQKKHYTGTPNNHFENPSTENLEIYIFGKLK